MQTSKVEPLPMHLTLSGANDSSGVHVKRQIPIQPLRVEWGAVLFLISSRGCWSLDHTLGTTASNHRSQTLTSVTSRDSYTHPERQVSPGPFQASGAYNPARRAREVVQEISGPWRQQGGRDRTWVCLRLGGGRGQNHRGRRDVWG